MMYKKFITICVVLLSACQATSNGTITNTNEITTHSSSPIKFRSNCGFPNQRSFEHNAGTYKFMLQDGDVGKCITDSKSYIGKSGYRKDFSERSEISIIPELKHDAVYEISFKQRVISGYDNGDRNETYFQIKNCPNSNVPVMAFMRLDETRNKVFAFNLGAGSAENVFLYGNNIGVFELGEWYEFEITYAAGKANWIAVKVNGKELLKKTYFPFLSTCNNADSLRIGNYRSGADKTANKRNTTSVSEYKDIVITKRN